jgi:tetratricopeptide (TPR) repeat protein
LQKLWRWIRENLVKAIVLAALTGSATAYLKGVFDSILGETMPKGAEIACAGREWVTDHWPSRPPETAPDIFRILVATVAGDDASATQTQAIYRAFQGQRAFDVLSTCRILKLEGAGPTAENATAKTGLEWPAKRNADILIFGEVLPKGEALNLHFLSSGQTADFAARSLRLESGLLKDEFKEATAAQLQAVALAAVKPATDQEGKYLVDTLRPVIVRLQRITAAPPPGMLPSATADVQFASGLALSVLGDQAGDNSALQEAVAAYRAALEERTRERVPLDWAMTQMNLGNALATLGARESGTKRLEEAVAALRAALEEQTRERVPLNWAMTQNNLGIALSTLGARESGTQRLEEAVAAYRAALEERTRERVPLDWATTQVNLGIALRTLGERESGQRLEEAVAAYRAALEEITRERVPLDGPLPR